MSDDLTNETAIPITEIEAARGRRLYFRTTTPGSTGGCIFDRREDAEAEAKAYKEHGEPDDEELVIVEQWMTPEEFAALPEFEGNYD